LNQNSPEGRNFEKSFPTAEITVLDRRQVALLSNLVLNFGRRASIRIKETVDKWTKQNIGQILRNAQ
jgi:hypothetical protein